MISESSFLIKTDGILLRDVQLKDEDAFLRWQTSGEWRFYDAPWEGFRDSMKDEEIAAFRKRFRENRTKPLSQPRKFACICTQSDIPIGWVTRYGSDRFPKVFYLGIDICEDEYLEKGLGPNALKAWIDYLFQQTDAHKLEIHCWSLNPRMIRVAEKLGFIPEGRERELIQWQGEWQDRFRFGMLREEWESLE